MRVGRVRGRVWSSGGELIKQPLELRAVYAMYCILHLAVWYTISVLYGLQQKPDSLAHKSARLAGSAAVGADAFSPAAGRTLPLGVSSRSGAAVDGVSRARGASL